MSVCYNCSERNLGCHSSCSRYLEEAKQAEARKKMQIKQQKEKDAIFVTKRVVFAMRCKIKNRG